MPDFGTNVRNSPALFGFLSVQAIPLPVPLIQPNLLFGNAAAPPRPTVADFMVSQLNSPPIAPLATTPIARPIPPRPTIADFMQSQLENIPPIFIPVLPPVQLSPELTVDVSRASSATVNEDVIIREPPPPIPRIPVQVRQPYSARNVPQDTLNLSSFSISNGVFQPRTNTGISSLRPEIISLFDFKSIYEPTGYFLTPPGKMLFLNWQMKKLRENTLNYLFNSLAANVDTSSLIDQIIEQYRDGLSLAGGKLQSMNSSLQQLNLAKQMFEIKTLPASMFDTRNFFTLRGFFERIMLYSPQSFAAFSDTKILYQIIFDARSIAESYSLSFLNSNDSDRAGDMDPITIDRTYGDRAAFPFSAQAISGKLGFLEADFSFYDSSLPINLEDRIKILTLFLSKELRISVGLSKGSVQNTLKNYYSGGVTGNPFDNIFGFVGSDIFKAPEGINSLSSLLFLLNSSTSILPFERKLVSDNQTSFIPGIHYFIDTILQLTTSGEFNTEPLNEYSQKFSEVVANARDIAYDLFDFNNVKPNLFPEYFIKQILVSIKDSLNTIRVAQRPDRDQLLTLSVISMSSRDSQLRFMLFQFVLLLGMASNGPNNRNPIFERVANEIGSIQNLSFVRADTYDNPDLKNGLRDLYPFLSKLATDIEERMFVLTGINETVSLANASLSLQGISSRASVSNDQESHVQISPGEIIISLLAASISDNSATSTVLRNLIEFCQQIDVLAEGYVVSTESTLNTSSTYNSITSSNIVLTIFHIFTSIVNKFFTCNVRNIQNIANVVFIQGRNEFILNTINSIVQTSPNPTNIATTSEASSSPTRNSSNSNSLPKTAMTIATQNSDPNEEENKLLLENQSLLSEYTHLQSSMNSIIAKLAAEEDAIKNVFHIFDVISSNISRNKDKVLQYFRGIQNTEGSINLANISSQQVQTNNWIYADLVSNYSLFGIKENILPEWKALSLLMTDPLYSRLISSQRIKLLTVGIPNGFSGNLFETSARDSIDSNFEKEKELDIIKICVHKKSMDDDNIIFQSQDFLFDLSLYSAQKNMLANEEDSLSFEQLLQSMKIADFSITNSTQANFNKLVTYDEFISDEKRDFLNLSVRRSLFKNHIVSDLLKFYIKGMTNLNLSEETFPTSRYQTTNATVLSEQLLSRFLVSIKGLTEEQANSIRSDVFFSDKTISASIKDDIRLLMTARSLTPTLAQEKILADKKFERVFTIPIDIDSFTIDRDLTTASFLGKQSLSSNALASNTESRAETTTTLYKDRSKEPNALILEEYFVTVEVVS